VTEPLKWYDEKDDHSPWIKALVEVRLRATREGWCSVARTAHSYALSVIQLHVTSTMN
jgi:hypothetical protein